MKKMESPSFVGFLFFLAKKDGGMSDDNEKGLP